MSLQLDTQKSRPVQQLKFLAALCTLLKTEKILVFYNIVNLFSRYLPQIFNIYNRTLPSEQLCGETAQ